MFNSSPPKCSIYATVSWVSIGSDNGFSPVRRQAIIWTNAGLLSIGPLGTNFSEILIKIQNFPITKMHLEISSAKRRPFCSGGDELKRPLSSDLGDNTCLLRGLSPRPKAHLLNSLRPRRNRRHFADDISRYILVNENVLVPIKISLKFIPKDPLTIFHWFR